MGINPIQQLKNKPSSLPSKLSSQGESPDNLLEKQDLEIENIEELTKENYNFFPLSFGIKPDQKLQNTIAILEVESPDPDKDDIIIRLYHALFKPQELPNIKITGIPKISFDQRMTNVNNNADLEKTSREFIGIMREVSKKEGKMNKLTSWLRCLQKQMSEKYQHELSYLIINDRTNYEIPWEMLEFKKNNYLGASIVTVRWQNIINEDDWDDENPSKNLEIQEHNCSGKVVAYLNTNDFKNIQAEQETLKRFNSDVYEDLDQFLQFLDSSEPQQDLSLIFIASHGLYGDSFQTEFGDSKKKISLIGLSTYDFNLLSKSSSIVFMNSCHSGRLHQDDPLNTRVPNSETGQYNPKGFAILFLEKGAKGFIGTLSKVDNEYAVKICCDFFSEYQINPQLSVANILKNLRQKAADQYKLDRNPENTLLLFYMFMYIYYGNPMTKLKLTTREDS